MPIGIRTNGGKEKLYLFKGNDTYIVLEQDPLDAEKNRINIVADYIYLNGRKI
jgi:hypothetical protein